MKVGVLATLADEAGKRDPGLDDPTCHQSRVRGGRSFLGCDFPNLSRDVDHNNIQSPNLTVLLICLKTPSKTHSSTSFLLPPQPTLLRNRRASFVSTRLRFDKSQQ